MAPNKAEFYYEYLPEYETIGDEKYQAYERIKQKIRDIAKTPEEYDRMISELVDELGI